MRLKSIKLAGFKSFVDPTTANFPTNLCAVVGPNGCGKSNIIDAVRWVMGESSAKNLRGDSMTDVIFNGSTGRKPVGQCSIDLIFDNSEGKLKGEYAQYNEISIRRRVTRDGQSLYYLNGTKCRRKDVTDLFLGTGLGPRSYSIIEQGMISKLIESKPEELRVFLEEAAGISKYKERRRDTENRMRRTTENLERLTDLRDELERQLSHLHRQAQAAEKYKELKAEERLLKAQVNGLKWKQLDDDLKQRGSNTSALEVEFEAKVAEQRANDSGIEEKRLLHIELQDEFDIVQTKFYEIGAEIARFEETIKHQGERAGQLQQDLADVERNIAEAQRALELDQLKQEDVEDQILGLEPELEMLLAAEEETAEALMQAEEDMQVWQQSWDDFNQSASEPAKKAEVAHSRIQHYEQNIERLSIKLSKIKAERDQLSSGPETEEVALLQEQLSENELLLEEQQEELETVVENIEQQREKNQNLSSQLNNSRQELQTGKGRKASLEALQQAALGQGSGAGNWLAKKQMANLPRLSQGMSVSGGWDRAVETVLGDHLQAVAVDGIDPISALLTDFEQGSISFVDGIVREQAPSDIGILLASFVNAKWDINGLMAGVFVANDLDQALAMRSKLSASESVITPEGLWFGPNWLRVARDEDANAGMLARQEELALLTERLDELDDIEFELEADVEAGQLRLSTIEQQRETSQREVNTLNAQLNEQRSQISAKQMRIEQFNNRKEQLEHDINELLEQQTIERETLGETRLALEEAVELIEQDTDLREELIAKREDKRMQLDQAKQKARHDKDQLHKIQLSHQALSNQQNSTGEAVNRIRQQMERHQERKLSLLDQMSQSDNPLDEMKLDLEAKLENRLLVEDQMTSSRTQLDNVAADLRDMEAKRQKAEQDAQEVRSKLEQGRMETQALEIRRQQLQEQLLEANFDLLTVINGLSDEINIKDSQAGLEQIGQRIQRLGAINLAAIEEYKTQSERKDYLDAQNADLEKALETLEGAIRKIDKETRTRFKETFDSVNAGLKELFPKVFGGGHAYLELTGDDLLNTGVAIMARPPGKKNSTIHLLSGGEKALTAIALVFSIFRLNPAPFCMLDEVDAPLDDANVARYANLVKAMSEQVQFIYITHNKIAMEMADQLMGVTMHEPGVSRMVSVNVEEAAELALQ
jgi:chromosome segregation protein